MYQYQFVIFFTIKNDVSGFEIEYFRKLLPNRAELGHGLLKIAQGTAAKRNLCLLQLKLFRIYLRNDHTLWSALRRTQGTNFSGRERLGCFFMYLCTIMLASALFYGIDQESIGDVMASFMISLFGTSPQLMAKIMFRNAKPEVVKRKLKVKFTDKANVEVFMLSDESLIKQTKNGNSAENNAKPLQTQEIREENFLQVLENTVKNVGDMFTSAVEMSEFDLDAKAEEIVEDTLLNTVNKALARALKTNDVAYQASLVEFIRETLFNQAYPWPGYCKILSWILLVIWSIFCCVLGIIYGFQFDQQYESQSQSGSCWELSQKLVLLNTLTNDKIAELQAAYIAPQTIDSFSADVTDSATWLLSLIQSIILSLIIWQPLTVYFTTWINLWFFSWNLKMKFGPKNIHKFVLYVCGCSAGHTTADSPSEMLKVVARKDRPLDIIGFFSNDALFLQLKENVTLEPIEENEENEVELEMEGTQEVVNETKGNAAISEK